MPQKSSAQMPIGSPEWLSAVKKEEEIEKDNQHRLQRRAAEDEAREIAGVIPQATARPRRSWPL